MQKLKEHHQYLRGEGDAEKNTILGDAYGLDEEFFDFLRTMQACRDTFGDTEMSMVIAPGQVCEKFFGEIEIQIINVKAITFRHWLTSFDLRVFSIFF